MTVRLLYFAAVRDIVGCAAETLEVSSTVATVTQLCRFLVRRYPALGPVLPHVRFAKNHAFVEGEAALAQGDTIALLPPVAGG